jgi:FHS family glucose/mannose:H+ symporter-like MFS transporter
MTSEPMRSTWKIRIALALNFFVIAILLNTVGIVIARVIEDYGVSGAQAASLEAFKDLSIAGASFLLASYVPRFGYRRTMLLGLMAVMLASMLVASVTGFWVTPVLYATIGISFALMKTAVYSTIGLIAETQSQHTGLLNNLEGVFQVGAMSGPLLFAFMIGFSRWTDTYWLLATLILIALVLMWFTRLDEHEIEEHAEEAGLLEMLKLLKRPIVWTFVICALLYVMIEQSFGTWLPRFHEQIFGLSAAVASGFMSFYFGSIALSRFVAGYLVKRVPWIVLSLTYLSLAFVVTLAVVLLTSEGEPETITSWLLAPRLAFLFSMVGFFIGPIYPTVSSIVLTKMPKTQQAGMTGLIIIFSALGGTTGSLITGRLTDILNTHDAFFFPLVPIALLALTLLPYKRLADRAANPHE